MTSDNLYETVLQRINPEQPEGRENSVTVLDIFNMLAKGMNTRAICKYRPEIRPESVTMAQAFLIAKHPKLYHENVAPISDSGLKLLVDENIAARVIPALRSGFSYATHTNFVGLNGEKDPEVWAWAVNNHIDALITRDQKMVHEDKDLTLIAIESAKNILRRMDETGLDVSLNELPLVIHVDAKHDVSNTVAEIYKKYRDQIHDYIETRTRPYIKVTSGGIIEGPRYATLLYEQKPEIRERGEQWVERWTQKIVQNRPDGHKLSDEDIEEIRQRVKDTVLPQVLESSQSYKKTRSGLAIRRKDSPIPK